MKCFTLGKILRAQFGLKAYGKCTIRVYFPFKGKEVIHVDRNWSVSVYSASSGLIDCLPFSVAFSELLCF